MLCIALAVVASQGLDLSFPVKEVIKTPQPWEYMTNEELPKSYDP